MPAPKKRTRKPRQRPPTGHNGKKRPDAREAFLNFEAMGHHDEDGKFVTQKEFAKRHRISEESLCRMKREEDWEDRVEARRKRLMGRLDRRIWARVAGKIGTAGDATLFSKRFGLFTDPDAGDAPKLEQHFHVHGAELVAEQRRFVTQATGTPSVEEALHDPHGGTDPGAAPGDPVEEAE
jgi:hypothetical protein